VRSSLAPVTLSPLDTDRFGIQSARVILTEPGQLPEVLAFCRENNVVFLTARCSIESLEIVHMLEQNGFNLMDTLIYYQLDLTHAVPIPASHGFSIRSIDPRNPADITGIIAAAQQSFQGYNGHYHADPRLDRTKCDEVYVSWATRSCTAPEVANNVLVAEREGQIIGFSTLKLNSSEEGECPLFAVIPNARGSGIYHVLVAHAVAWHRSQGVQRVISSTQISNIASQRTWSRNGWVPDHAFYTFHKWFD
jgi:GNAT superfamily N-acetyltransferase